jgi:hypothetical protein
MRRILTATPFSKQNAKKIIRQFLGHAVVACNYIMKAARLENSVRFNLTIHHIFDIYMYRREAREVVALITR